MFNLFAKSRFGRFEQQAMRSFDVKLATGERFQVRAEGEVTALNKARNIIGDHTGFTLREGSRLITSVHA